MIMSFLDTLKNIGEAILELLFEAGKSFFEAAIKNVVEQGGKALLESATRAVTAANAMDGDGDAKFDAAFDSVKNDMVKEGLSVAKSTINVAIEAAYQNLKADLEALNSQPDPQ